jgi:hypothetical protein
MRTILIDPAKRTITELDLPDPHKLQDTYDALDCHSIDVIRLGQGVDMWVNDEGLCSFPLPEIGEGHFFVLHSQGQPHNLIAGKALVTGVNRAGDTVALQPHITTDFMKMFVRFIPDDKFHHACELAAEIVDNTGVVDSQEELDRLRQRHAAILHHAMELATINPFTHANHTPAPTGAAA